MVTLRCSKCSAIQRPKELTPGRIWTATRTTKPEKYRSGRLFQLVSNEWFKLFGLQKERQPVDSSLPYRWFLLQKYIQIRTLPNSDSKTQENKVGRVSILTLGRLNDSQISQSRTSFPIPFPHGSRLTLPNASPLAQHSKYILVLNQLQPLANVPAKLLSRPFPHDNLGSRWKRRR